ncbi:MAG TPA: flavodoxin family protein [Bacteroidales bacterium]|nr:flavodoxin family protein [Bacteroidales bacterium]
MKISVLNFSLRKTGRTSKVFYPFIKGLQKSKDNKIELYHLTDWEIKNCQGCSHCWFIDPGNCIINDDFSKQIKNIITSDLIVFASPIWVGNGTHLFRTFAERLFGTIKPDFIEHPNHIYGHNNLQNRQIKTILISTCALPGYHNFSSLIENIKSFDYLCNFNFIGSLLKSQSLELDIIDNTSMKYFTEIVYNAGRNVSDEKKFNIFASYLETNFIEINKYITLVNQKFDRQTER